MARHSSTLAWKIPPMEEPGRLQSMGSWRVGHDWSKLACMHALEKEMATHSSILAWRIPGMAEPGGLPSIGSHRVRHDWSDLAAAAARNPKMNFSPLSFFTNEHCLLWKLWLPNIYCREHIHVLVFLCSPEIFVLHLKSKKEKERYLQRQQWWCRSKL